MTVRLSPVTEAWETIHLSGVRLLGCRRRVMVTPHLTGCSERQK